MMGKIKFLIFSYFLVLISFFLYSFTQVDLSLTLSKSSIFQTIEKNFQYLGFYERPISASIFSVILLFLFSFYLIFLILSIKHKLTTKNLIYLVGGTFLLLWFSYNAFSYDLFNYIFYHKIIFFYHQNPYLFKPADFIGDPMLSFMRWTHLTYPYGPSWLLITIPVYLLGFNFFLPTFLLFKLFIGLTCLGSSILIYKISEIIFPENKISNTVFFALNPLVLIEGFISSHNDISMVFFTLLAFYFYLKNKKISSVLTFIFSIGIKYLNAVLIPIGFYIAYLKIKGKKINWEKIIAFGLLLSLLQIVIISCLRGAFQPWYTLLSISMASFIWKKYYVLVPFFLMSLFSSLTYVPYVLLTDYAKNYPQTLLTFEQFGLITTIMISAIWIFYKKLKHSL